MFPAPIRRIEARRTETPNAVMTTFASPSLGQSSQLSLWQVEMQQGQLGPVHVFDSEQVWTVAEGRVSVVLGDDSHDLDRGDTIVMPAGAVRQIGAHTDARLIVCGMSDAVVLVPGEASPRGTPPWIA